MAVVTKLDPLNRDIELIFREELAPEARRRNLARHAREAIDAATAANRRALGAPVGQRVYVDGRPDAPLESVRPDGTVVAEFDLQAEAVRWVGSQLFTHSPFKSGRYRGSKPDGGHLLFVDGEEIGRATADGVSVAIPARATRLRFIPAVPYARRIEQGWSKQAPNGVYQAVAALARRRFGNIVRITFGYAPLIGSHESKPERKSHPSRTEMRQPVIDIVL